MNLYHIKRALSYLLRLRSHTIYSLSGLVIGLACLFVISAWAMQELQYDRYHSDADQIYMVTTNIRDNNGEYNIFPETPPPLAHELESQIPQIEAASHFVYLYGGRPIRVGETTFKEVGIAADSNFIEVFDFQLKTGSPDQLDEPNAIFLSESLAEKLFPLEDPMEKNLLFLENNPLVVKGIFKDIPINSSIQFEYIIPYQIVSEGTYHWWALADATFIKASKFADREELHQSMRNVWREAMKDDQFDIGLIPITSLRYEATFEFFNAEHGNSRKLYMFIGIALLILTLACLNYMNLISAYALKREKEFWIRKVNGASSGIISGYLLTESIIMSLLAWLLAILLSLLGLQAFERLMDVDISAYYIYLSIGFGLIASILLVGLASGVYPAIRLSRGVLVNPDGNGWKDQTIQRKMKNAFVLSQFILSISLIICSMIMARQVNFMKSFDLGYEREDIILITLPSDDGKNHQAINNSLSANSHIECFSIGGTSPVNLPPLFTAEGWKWEGLQEGTHTSVYRVFVDQNYLEVFGISLVSGKFFSGGKADTIRVVINESLAVLTGFDNPVGRHLRFKDQEYEIIGIVRDFNFQHLSNPIHPLLFLYADSNRKAFLKTDQNSELVLKQLQSLFAEFSDQPISYNYVEEEYEQLYKNEDRILSAILIFTLISIFLSSLGLVALVSYSTKLKIKEIAVRKVYGAETYDILIRLNLSFLRLFLPGMLVGGFISWIVMRKWFENFANRGPFEWWIFLLGAFIILIITLLTVSAQTWKASILKPVEALKCQ
jgi:putative ABC transport system permease protein